MTATGGIHSPSSVYSNRRKLGTLEFIYRQSNVCQSSLALVITFLSNTCQEQYQTDFWQAFVSVAGHREGLENLTVRVHLQAKLSRCRHAPIHSPQVSIESSSLCRGTCTFTHAQKVHFHLPKMWWSTAVALLFRKLSDSESHLWAVYICGHKGRCVRVQNEKSKKETCTWPITGLHRRKACHPLTFPLSLWSHGGPSTSASRAKEGNWGTQEEERRRKAGKLKGHFLGKRGFFFLCSSSCGSSGGSDFPWVGGLIPCPSLFVTDLRKDMKPGVCVNRWMRNR